MTTPALSQPPSAPEPPNPNTTQRNAGFYLGQAASISLRSAA